MSERTLGILLAALFIGAVLLLAWSSRRRYREVETEERILAKGLDAPDMDEPFAHQIAPAPSIEQVARDKGAV